MRVAAKQVRVRIRAHPSPKPEPNANPNANPNPNASEPLAPPKPAPRTLRLASELLAERRRALSHHPDKSAGPAFRGAKASAKALPLRPEKVAFP